MKIRLAVLILLLVTATNIYGAATAFIVNNLAETLSRIDLESGNVQNHVTVLGDIPNQIRFYDGHLYVVNSISANLQKIDPVSNQIVADIPFVVGSNPYSIEFDGNYAYVSSFVFGFIYRVNLNTNEVDNQILIGGFPEGMLVIDGKLYVAQTAFNPNDFSYGQGQIAKIDLASMMLDEEINVGNNPQSFIQVSDTLFHVVCTGNYNDVAGSVYIFNHNEGIVLDSILIGGQPVSGALGNENIAYLAAGGWVDHGYVYTYNIDTKQIIHGPSNPIQTGLGVSSIAVDSLGYIYSCNFGDDSVTKFDSQGRTLATYGVGDGPQSMVILDNRVSGLVDNSAALPEESRLLGNYPNPFNSQTTIKYILKGTSSANLELYDIRGALIKQIAVNAGIRSVVWDGSNEAGEACAGGIYLARLISQPNSRKSGENSSSAIKLLYVK